MDIGELRHHCTVGIYHLYARQQGPVPGGDAVDGGSCRTGRQLVRSSSGKIGLTVIFIGYIGFQVVRRTIFVRRTFYGICNRYYVTNILVLC